MVGLVLGNVVGLVLGILGWWEASGRSSTQSQLRWLNLTLVGLVVVCVANGLWLARGHRTVTSVRMTLLQSDPSAATGAVAAASVMANGHLGLAWVPGTSSYHRPECLFVVGKKVTQTGREEHERVQRQPCEVCRP